MQEPLGPQSFGTLILEKNTKTCTNIIICITKKRYATFFRGLLKPEKRIDKKGHRLSLRALQALGGPEPGPMLPMGLRWHRIYNMQTVLGTALSIKSPQPIFLRFFRLELHGESKIIAALDISKACFQSSYSIQFTN